MMKIYTLLFMSGQSKKPPTWYSLAWLSAAQLKWIFFHSSKTGSNFWMASEHTSDHQGGTMLMLQVEPEEATPPDGRGCCTSQVVSASPSQVVFYPAPCTSDYIWFDWCAHKHTQFFRTQLGDVDCFGLVQFDTIWMYLIAIVLFVACLSRAKSEYVYKQDASVACCWSAAVLHYPGHDTMLVSFLIIDLCVALLLKCPAVV